MDFSLTEEQHAIREAFRRLVDDKVAPRAGEIDRAAEFPRDEFRAVGELGFFGMRYPEEVGTAWRSRSWPAARCPSRPPARCSR
jgi:butyryl-CoA dehydrogenase